MAGIEQKSLSQRLRLFVKYQLKRRPVDHPEPETGLGVVLLDFDIDAYRDTIEGRAERHTGRFEIDCLAELPYRDRLHPMMRVRASGDAAHRTSLLMLCGVHGNEHAGPLAIPRVLDRLAERPDDFAHLDLCIVTPVNPVGAQQGSRYNADGYDINRDFAHFDTPEAKIVREVMEEMQPDFVLSLHEGPQNGAFMFANPHVDGRLAEPLVAGLVTGGSTPAEVDYFGRRLPSPGWAPYGDGAGMRIFRFIFTGLLGQKSTGGYSDDHGTPEIVLETPWRGDGEIRIQSHVDVVLALMAALSAETRRSPRGPGC